MNNVLSDARHAIRGFARTPGFTATALATLALGIGANTAIFTVIDTVLIDRLPYPASDRIVNLGRPGGGGTSEPAFSYWEQNNPALEDLTAYHSGASTNLNGGDRPELVETVTTSRNYFHLFGANPIIGRTFTAAEDAPGGPRVLVISYGLWQRRFGGDPSILGKTIALGGAPYSMIGVLAPSFRPPSPADVWTPLQADPNSTNEAGTLTVSGRLPAGVTLVEASARMAVVAKRYVETSSTAFKRDPRVQVVLMKQRITGDARPSLLILLGAVGLVLLLACANVANMLLARASGRAREIAVRAALGAGRGRIVRQLLIESLLLALAGGAIGLMFGSWGVRALLALAPADLPRIQEIAASPALNPEVAAFTLLLAIATGVLFGLLPAIEVSRTDLAVAIKDSNARAGGGHTQGRTRDILVAAEVAIAIVLLSGAVLLIRSFAAMHGVDPGFDPNNLLTMQTSLAGPGYSHSRDVDLFSRQFVERAERIPGVESAAVASALPLFGLMDMIFDIPGRRPLNGPQFAGDVQWRFVSSHYFDVLRIPVISGRALQEHEPGRTVVISQAMARKFWPGANPVGQSIFIGPGLGPAYQVGMTEVVGVVGDVRERLELDPSPVMYQAPSQFPDADMALLNGYEPAAVLIRTRPGVAPISVSQAVEHVLLAGNSLAVSNIRTMQKAALASTARQNFNVLLLSLFAGIALLLAAVGIYGVLSYTVEQRTQEIGIRAALGASRRDTLGLVLRQTLRTALAGIVSGIAASLALTRLMRAQLFGVTPSDPLTFTMVPLVLVAVAVAAAYVPAQRAARVDPVVALRHS